LDLSPEALIARTAIHIEEKGYGDDVGIIFRRTPRLFRLVGLDGRETADVYVRWSEAYTAATREPKFVALSIYYRGALFELHGHHDQRPVDEAVSANGNKMAP
jgi:hypothetical protein